jgi:hypothetical protein
MINFFPGERFVEPEDVDDIAVRVLQRHHVGRAGRRRGVAEAAEAGGN